MPRPQRFPGEYRIVSEGVDAELFKPGKKRQLVVLEWRPIERPLARAVQRALRELTDWELVYLRTKKLAGRPAVPAKLRGRARVRTARDGKSRAPILAEAAIFVPALEGLPRVSLEAAAAGAAIASPPGVQEQPELAAAALARFAENEPLRTQLSEEARRGVEGKTFDDVGAELEELYESLGKRRRTPRPPDPLADRDWILADLHLHTSWSADCSVEVEDLLDHAESAGLGAIAVTDHNVFGGALEAVELARGREPDRDPRRGGQDRRPGRGDRALPVRGDPAWHVLRGHDRRDQGPGRSRLPPASVRPHALDPGPGDAASQPRRRRRVRGLQRAPALRGLQRRGAQVRPQVQPD